MRSPEVAEPHAYRALVASKVTIRVLLTSNSIIRWKDTKMRDKVDNCPLEAISTTW